MLILSKLFALFCAFILPLGAAAFLCARRRGLWRPLLLGAATFVVFQLLFRLPLLQLVLARRPWFIAMSMGSPLLYALFLGLTAALVEELGRYLVMRLFMRRHQTQLDALALGLGHGGIEAILLVGVNALALLFVSGGLYAPASLLAAGLERLSALCVHTAWSMMVMRSVREGRLSWLFAALAMHAALDAASAYAMRLGLSVWAIEGALLLCAALALVYIIKQLRKGETQE